MQELNIEAKVENLDKVIAFVDEEIDNAKIVLFSQIVNCLLVFFFIITHHFGNIHKNITITRFFDL